MTNEERLVDELLKHLGGKDNVRSATNCMTRLRVRLADGSAVDEDGVKNTEGVLGLVRDNPTYLEIVVGPGKSRKCADVCAAMGIPANAADAEGGVSTSNDWQANKAAVKASQSEGRIKRALKTVGQIFVPLIPGVVAAGICSGLGTLLAQLNPGYAADPVWGTIWNILALINSSLLTYITAWAGYRAAEQFGGTPILGGMLGMITSLSNIDSISQLVGLYNEAQPLDAILRAGRGGVLAVILGVWFLVKVEKFIRKRMPDALDIVCTPLLTLIITVVPYVFLVMPVTGYISTFLVWVVEQICMNEILAVRIIGGYIASALFLPLVAMGMHHGLVALYSVQLETLGYVTLYPTLAMAGAGQVGAAIAIWLKAKKVHNDRIRSVIDGALPAGFLGVGEPLIYGVTLPMGKPFVTAGLGAGFGGAFVMACQIGATAWGPSGLIAIPLMTQGANDATMSMLFYVIGLVISYIGGFIITNIFVKPEEVAGV